MDNRGAKETELKIEDGGLRIEDRRLRIEDRRLRIEDRRFNWPRLRTSIFNLRSSIFSFMAWLALSLGIGSTGCGKRNDDPNTLLLAVNAGVEADGLKVAARGYQKERGVRV